MKSLKISEQRGASNLIRNSRATNALLAALLLLACIPNAAWGLTATGPFIFPVQPPGGVTFVSAPVINGQSGGAIAKGGQNWTFSNVKLADKDGGQVYWAFVPNSIQLGIFGNNQTLVFVPGSSSLNGGVLVFTATIVGSPTVPVTFTATITDQNNNPVKLIDPTTVGLQASVGGAVRIIDGTTFSYKVNMRFTSFGIGTYDYANNNNLGATTSDVTGGLYYVNTAPTLTPGFDNTQTVVIPGNQSSTALPFSVSDNETATGSLVTSVSAVDTTLFPNGSLSLTNLGSGNYTLTMTPALNQSASTTVTVSVLDADGATSSFSIPVVVTPALKLQENRGVTVDQTQTVTITNTLLSASDSLYPPTQIIYTIPTGTGGGSVAYGSLKNSGAPLIAGSTFTQDDINNNRITYTETDTSGQTHDGFQFGVTDPGGGFAIDQGHTTFTFPININLYLQVATNVTLPVNQTATVVVPSSNLQATDTRFTSTNIVYTILSGGLPQYGVLKKNNAAVSVGGTFTQDDIDGGIISYTETDNTGQQSDGFKFSVSDPYGAMASTGTVTGTTFTFKFAINRTVKLAINTGVSLNQRSSVNFSNTALLTTDSSGGADAQITYTFINGARNGKLRKNTTALAPGDTFTQQDIDDQIISYATDDVTDVSGELVDDFQISIKNSQGFVAGDNGFTTFTVPITITFVNRPPVANNGNANVGLGATYNGTLSATDPDKVFQQPGGQTLTYTVDQPQAGSVSTNAQGQFTYVAPGTPQQDSFVFHVTDGFATADGVFTLNVQNQPPTAINGSGSTTQGVALNGTLAATDPDLPAQQLTFSLKTNGSRGSANVNANGTFTYTPSPYEFGTDSFMFNVVDALGAAATPGTFTVTIVPKVTPGDIFVADSQAAAVILIDPVTGNQFKIATGLSNAQSITFEASGTLLVSTQNNNVPSIIRVDPATGQQTPLVTTGLSMPLGMFAEASGSFLVADGTAGVNRYNANGTPAGNVLPGGHVLATGVAEAANGDIYINNGLFFFGQGEPSVVVKIPSGGNPATFASGGDITLPLGIALDTSGNVYISDVAQLFGNQPTLPNLVLKLDSAGNQTRVGVDGSIVGPTSIAVDSAGKIVTASAGSASIVRINPATQAQTVLSSQNFLVQPFGLTLVPNTVPVADSQTFTYSEGAAAQPLPVTLTATDADNGPRQLSYRVIQSPARGSLSGTAPALTYTPAHVAFEADSFVFVANDGIADSPPATITINVPNNPPTVVASDFQAAIGSPTILNFSFSDPGSAVETYTASVNWGDGNVDSNIAVTSGANQVSHTYASRGNFTVVIAVTDSNNGVGQATVKSFAVSSSSLAISSAWAGFTTGTLVYLPGDPNPHWIGYDAFPTFSAAIVALTPGGTISMSGGTYGGVNASMAFTFAVPVATDVVTFTGPFTGTGPVGIAGPGAIEFIGTGGYTGVVNVTGGTLKVNSATAFASASGVTVSGAGSVVGGFGLINGGFHAFGNGANSPGNSPSTQTFNGDYDLTNNGQLDVEIQGFTTAGTDYDQVIVTGGGMVKLDTTSILNIDLNALPKDTPGDANIIKYPTGNLSGVFAPANIHILNNNFRYNVAVDTTSFTDKIVVHVTQPNSVTVDSSVPSVGTTFSDVNTALNCVAPLGTILINTGTGPYDAAGFALYKQVTFSVNAGQSPVISGSISNASPSIVLVKAGPGTLTLSGTDTYLGATNVSAGTLLINSPGSLTIGGGAVSVNSNATLGGDGTINRDILVTSGGTLAPGTPTSYGILHGGNVTLQSGAKLLVKIKNFSVAGTDFDQLSLTGSLTLDSALAVNATNMYQSGTAAILVAATKSGTFTGGLSFINGIAGTTGLVSYPVGSGNVSLQVTVPPPSPVYVDPLFAGTTAGAAPTTSTAPGVPPPATARFLYDSFATITQGVAAVAPAGNVIVNGAGGSGYHETVTISKALFFTGAGDLTTATTDKFILDIGSDLTGSAGVTAPAVDLNQTGAAVAKLSDGLLVASTNAVVSLASGARSFGAATLTRDVQLNVASASAIVGSLSGTTGNVTKIGAGTLIYSGTDTYSGTTTISAGTLEVDGSLSSNVTIGGSGLLSGTGPITGSITTQTGGRITPGVGASELGVLAGGDTNVSVGGVLTLRVKKVTSATAGTDFGQLDLTGHTLTLGGTSTLVLDFNGLIAAGGPVSIATYNSVSGVFKNVTVINDVGFTYKLDYTSDANNLLLTILPVTNTFVDKTNYNALANGTSVTFANDPVPGSPHIIGVDAFTTIASGITACQPTYTCYVAKATYSENITLNKAMTLKGEQAGVPGYVNPAGPAPTTASTVRPVANETIIAGATGFGAVVNVTSPTVVIDGVRIVLPASGSGGFNQGITNTAAVTSLTVQNSVLDYSASTDANTYGINVPNAATFTYVATENAFTGNSTTANGTATASAQTSGGNAIASVSDNLIVHSSSGIVGAFGGGAGIQQNVILGATSGLNVATNNTLVQGNTFSGCADAVIIQPTYGGSLDITTLTGNTFVNNLRQLNLIDTVSALVISGDTIAALDATNLKALLPLNTLDRAVYGTGNGGGDALVNDESGFVIVRSDIQSSVTAASATDTVHVLNGTYTENVTVPKALTILGNGAANTTVKAAAGDVFTLTHDTISIQNLTVDGLTTALNGINTNGAANLTAIVVDSLTIQNLKNSGVKNSSANGATTVNNCTIKTIGGAVASGAAGISISNGTATITKNTVSSAAIGVLVASSPAGATVVVGGTGAGNTISGCIVGALSRASASTAGDVISFNTLSNNTYGAVIEQPATTTSQVTSNTVKSTSYGIAVFGGSATVSSNTISPFATGGVGLLASSIVPPGGDFPATLTANGNILTGLDTGLAVAKGTSATQFNATLNSVSASVAGIGVQFAPSFTDYLGVTQTGNGGSATLTNNQLKTLATGALVNNSGVLTLLQNTIQSNTIGVDESTGTINTIQNNFITLNAVGVQFESAANGLGTIFNNDLSVNTSFAVKNLTSPQTAVDASGNWWGGFTPVSVTGAISGLADYSPWLHTGTPLALATPGFNGDFTWLHVDNHSANAGSVTFIQEGVNLATAGGKVQVEDGATAYTEDVTIAKDLTLVSTHASGSVTIAGVGTTATSGAIKVTAGKVAIGTGASTGFTINGAGQAAVYLDSTAGVCSVTGNIISAADTSNALLALSSGHTLASNTFKVATGKTATELVNIGTSATPTAVTGNTFTGANAIGLLQQADGSAITTNDFSNSASVTARVKLDAASAGTISGNNFKNAPPVSGFGAQFWDLQRSVANLRALYAANTFDRGALVGYGTTAQLAGNNGQAIFDRLAKAIAAAAGGATPSPIDIRTGFYDESNIAVDRSVSLDGQTPGNGNVQVVPVAAAGSAFVLSSGAVTIQNLTVDGSGGAAGKTYDFAISAPGAAALDGVTINQNTLKNIGTSAVDFSTTVLSSGLAVTGNTISATPTGLKLTHVDSTVIGNSITGTSVAGIDVDATLTTLPSTFNSNTVSGTGSGLKLAHLAKGSVVGAPTLGNLVTLTGNTDDLYAILVDSSQGTVSVSSNTVSLGTAGTGKDVGIGVLSSGGAVTVDANTISCQKGNSGIFLYGNGTGLVFVTNNSLTATNATAGAATGRAVDIALSDILLYNGPGTTTAGDAVIGTNSITGFDRGIDILQLGTPGGGLTATVGGSGTGNTITSAVTSGIRVRDTNQKGINAPSANAQISNNSITGTGIGLDIDGAAAFAGQNSITGNLTVGVRLTNKGVATGAPGLFQNTITTLGVGVLAVDGGTLDGAEQNFITGNASDGIKIAKVNSDGFVTAKIFNNKLSGNGGKAVNNATVAATTVDASGNWFGFTTQTAVTATVSAAVDYTPWLNSGADGNTGVAGFQGDFTFLNVWNGSPQTAGNFIDEATGLLTGSGFIVQVWPNTTAYNETVTLNKTVDLRGAKYTIDPLSRSSGAGESIIDGSGQGSPLVFVATSGTGSSIDGFTIRKAVGVSVQFADTSATLSNNIINGFSGGIAVQVSSNSATVRANLLNAGAASGSTSGISLDPNVTGATIDSNEIQSCSVAAVTLLGGNNTTTIKNNKLLQNSGAGVSVQGATSSTVKVNSNSIQSFSQDGLLNTSTSVLDATLNFWGDSSGPYDSVNNLAGLGSNVTGLGKTYSEWLGNGADQFPAQIGFQPFPSPLYGLATQLTFVTPPGDGLVNQLLAPQPVIQALDLQGNLALSFNGPVTVLLFNNTNFASLIGTTTIFATNGVIRFNDLGVNKAGTYNLRAVSSGLTPQLSASFTINPTGTPNITSINPAHVQQNSGSFLLDITDTSAQMTAGTSVLINGTAVSTTYVSTTEVYAVVPATVAATAGTKTVSLLTNSVASNTVVLTVNAPPVAVNDSFTTPFGSAPFIADVLANDTTESGETLTITAITQPAHGSAVLNATNDRILYTPDLNFTTTDSVNYTISDGNGGTASAKATFTAQLPVPAISALSPSTVFTGTTSQVLTITGTGFTAGTTVKFSAATPIVPSAISATSITVTVPDAELANAGSVPVTVTTLGGTSAPATLTVSKRTPTISWPTPVSITYGTPLSATQLNAVASTAGSYIYLPPATTILDAGVQTLSVTFNPTDTNNYTSATATVQLNVLKASPVVTLSGLNVIYDGSPKPITVTTTPSPLATTVLYNGSSTAPTTAGTYNVLVTINDLDYASTTNAVLNIAKATPIITWSNPAAITYGTALSSTTELNATSSVAAGSFVYNPLAGIVLNAGANQTLTTTFTPTDTTNYTTATKSVTIDVNKATPTITWPTPADINYGTVLSATQLNATSGGLPGSFVYTPAAGTVLGVGNAQGLSVTFTPTDSVNYASVTKTTTINVLVTTPTITWNNPADITYGTALSSTQLNATSGGIAGAFVYTPPSGTVLNAASGQLLSVTFTPTDTNYPTVTATAKINVNKATPTITWATPVSITYGTALTATQLNAGASTGGSFTYAPDFGAILHAGVQTLTVTFDPTDTTNYTTATATVQLNVLKASPVVTLGGLNAIYDGSPKPITVTTTPSPLNTTVLYNGSSSAPTTAGTYNVLVTINDLDYASTTNAVLNIAKATPIITWSNPSAITYGTALSTTELNASSSVASGSFVYNPLAGIVLNAGANQTLTTTFTPTDTTNYTTATKSVTIDVNKATPTITWPTPADITYGTALSATQLNATSGGLPGSFAYTPAAGTVLTVGNAQSLSVTFTPTDSVNYASVTKTTTINVLVTTPTITWNNPADITYGTALSSTQLNATSGGVAGTFAYTPAAGTVLNAGSGQLLSVTFTPSDLTNYAAVTATAKINVLMATPTITWATPLPIVYGTALDNTQLNATASTPGSFTYLPVSGAVLNAGVQTLTATFAPTDTTNFTGATASVQLTVQKAAPPTFTLSGLSVTYDGNPKPITVTTSPASLAATATILYNGSVTAPTNAGTYNVLVTINDTNYTGSTNAVLFIAKATPAITWANPSPITYGTALSSTELNATSATAGSFAYAPPSGTVLNAGVGQTLSTTFTPTDTANYNSATATALITVNNPAPAITQLNPASATAGGSGFSLTLTGTGFVPGSVVYWNGSARTTIFSSSTQLVATIPAADIATGGSASVTVTNPAPAGGTSSAATFTINNPATPAISGLTPAFITAGSAGFTLTVNGSNFATGAVIQWNGTNLTTAFVSSTQLTASISAASIASAGSVLVTVFNPLPSGGLSSAATFTVLNPAPSISNLSQTTATQGASGFTLTITGSNFVAGSVCQWNGLARVTTFVSSTQITAAITTADLAVVKANAVTVFNPGPGGGTSSAATLDVTAPNAVPVITSVSPSSTLVGTAGLNIMLNGTGFAPTATVNFNGVSRPTAFINSTLLIVVIPAGDLSAAGTASITVVNPAPGGGTSAAANFSIDNPAPVLTDVSPLTATAGDAATAITVSGVNFVSASKIQFGGISLTTTFVSATQLTATIPAASLTAAGSFAITVASPTPGGGVSNAVTYLVKGKLVVTSAATATPNPAKVGQVVTATVAGVDPSGVALTVSWDFGDGSPAAGGASATHTYTTPQVYTITATMFDTQGNTIKSTTTVTVAAAATPPGTITIVKAALKGKNPSLGKDVLSLGGSLALPATVTSLSGPLTISIGSVSKTFTLNAKGSGTASPSSFKFGKRTSVAPFTAKISANLSSVLVAAGVPAGGSGKATIPITINFGGADYAGTVTLNVTTTGANVVGK